jgi:hypothetical protein
MRKALIAEEYARSNAATALTTYKTREKKVLIAEENANFALNVMMALKMMMKD